MPPKAEPKKGGKAAEAEPAVDVPKAMKDLRPRWEKLSAAVGVPLENKVFPRALRCSISARVLIYFAGHFKVGRLPQKRNSKGLLRGGGAHCRFSSNFSPWTVRKLQRSKNRQAIQPNPQALFLAVSNRGRGLHRPRAVAEIRQHPLP